MSPSNERRDERGFDGKGKSEEIREYINSLLELHKLQGVLLDRLRKEVR